MTTTRAEKAMETAMTYDELIQIGARSLAADEFWCIEVEGKPLELTASKDMTYPIRLFCKALDMDWDDAQESGARLSTVRLYIPVQERAGGVSDNDSTIKRAYEAYEAIASHGLRIPWENLSDDVLEGWRAAYAVIAASLPAPQLAAMQAVVEAARAVLNNVEPLLQDVRSPPHPSEGLTAMYGDYSLFQELGESWKRLRDVLAALASLDAEGQS